MYKYNFNFHWFRRDLRLVDNTGLWASFQHSPHTFGLFIFDPTILNQLQRKNDPRVQFIFNEVKKLQYEFRKYQSDLFIFYGKPVEVYQQMVNSFKTEAIMSGTFVEDYEPYARQRDNNIQEIFHRHQFQFYSVKDQCLFSQSEILTESGKPYTVYTPYKKKVLNNLTDEHLQFFDSLKCIRTMTSHDHIQQIQNKMSKIGGFVSDQMTLNDLGFTKSVTQIPDIKLDLQTLLHYKENRDFPAIQNGTSRLGVHFRFGTISIREYAKIAKKYDETWLSELIWRDFFMQILWHYPYVVKQSFRKEYDELEWRENKDEFECWKNGMTGYPLVDAGMRELLATGHMHNRVRMVVASFLTKHLFMHWRQGERYFAQHLLDYDLAANNGNWQWAAGTGCDAAPYFRIFNPITQAEKFDADHVYIRQWVPELNTLKYPKPMIEHAEARSRALHGFSRLKK